MPNRQVLASILCVMLLGLLIGKSAAEVLPSFHFEGCAWHATDVVVASEGETIDGRLTVIESWVGSLTPGATVNLPELAIFAPEEKRQEWDWGKPDEDGAMVSGRRMVLFLERGRSDADGEWAPATRTGGMKVSVCWIESGEAYGVVQNLNPGPALMTRLGLTEAAMRTRTQGLRAEKAALAVVRALEDVTQRVEAATTYARSESSFAPLEAIDILQDAGAPAVPSLLALVLSDEPTSTMWPAARALGEIGDPSVVAPLVEALEKELTFWTEAANHLQRGWWNGKGLEGSEVKQHRWQYARVSQPLRVLTAVAAPGFEDVVRRTRALWRGHQVLHEVGSGQMVEHCDQALAALEAKQQPPK